MVEEICLRILKAIGEAVLSVVGFVIGLFVETVIELRWVILVVLVAMAFLWWMLQDPHIRGPRPYRVDSSPDRIMR